MAGCPPGYRDTARAAALQTRENSARRLAASGASGGVGSGIGHQVNHSAPERDVRAAERNSSKFQYSRGRFSESHPQYACGRPDPTETGWRGARPGRHRCLRHRRHQRHASRLSDVRAADGDPAAWHDAGGDRRPDRGDGAVGRAGHVSGAGRSFGDAGRQAQHRGRRRQDVARAGAARRGVRRVRADDVGSRPRPHRRHARQARGHSRLSHRLVARRAEGSGRAPSGARSSVRRRRSRPPIASSTRSGTSPPRSRAFPSFVRRS